MMSPHPFRHFLLVLGYNLQNGKLQNKTFHQWIHNLFIKHRKSVHPTIILASFSRNSSARIQSSTLNLKFVDFGNSSSYIYDCNPKTETWKICSSNLQEDGNLLQPTRTPSDCDRNQIETNPTAQSTVNNKLENSLWKSMLPKSARHSNDEASWQRTGRSRK